MYRYNIVVDHEDGTCNLIYSAVTPYFSFDCLVYYTYSPTSKKYERHTINMRDARSISITKIGD